MIYAPDGTIATKDVVAMTWTHLSWLNDGHAFLRHLKDLRALKLDVICLFCHQRGRDDAIEVRPLEDEKKYVATCRHAHRLIPFSGITSGDELRCLYKWAFRCRARSREEQDCERRGYNFWIEPGANEPTSKELRLSCGCTDRVWRRQMLATGQVH